TRPDGSHRTPRRSWSIVVAVWPFSVHSTRSGPADPLEIAWGVDALVRQAVVEAPARLTVGAFRAPAPAVDVALVAVPVAVGARVDAVLPIADGPRSAGIRVAVDAVVVIVAVD